MLSSHLTKHNSGNVQPPGQVFTPQSSHLASHLHLSATKVIQECYRSRNERRVAPASPPRPLPRPGALGPDPARPSGASSPRPHGLPPLSRPPAASTSAVNSSETSKSSGARVEPQRRQRRPWRWRRAAPSSGEAGRRIRRRLRYTQVTAAADTNIYPAPATVYP